MTGAARHIGPVAMMLLAGAMTGCGFRSSDADLKIPTGWRKVSVADVSFNAPADVKKIPVRPVDSFVEAFRSPDLYILVELGRHCDTLGHTGQPEYRRARIAEGHVAGVMEIFRRQAPDDGLDCAVMAHFPRDGGWSQMTIVILCRNRAAQDTARRIVGSVSYPVSRGPETRGRDSK